MEINKLVVRFKDKTLMKGRAVDFSPNRMFFTLKLLNGKETKVNMDKLKAAFFVKSFTGNKDYKYTYKDVIPWGGNKIKVEFIDGEVIVGYTQHYPFDNHGFFLTPADLNGNNKSIFAVNSAIKRIKFV